VAVGGVVTALALTAATGADAAVTAVFTRAAGAPVRGLDISAYQHAGTPINWGLLAGQGIRFVAIKVSEGTYYVNPYYPSDARSAAAAGLAVLPYVFANPSRASPTATVKFAVSAISAIGGERGHLPLVVDLENDPYNKSADCYRLPVPAMLAWIAGFTAQAEALTGKWPVIYTTEDWWRECTGSAGQFRHDPLWLAAFDGTRPSVPSPWRGWTFWQYSNDGSLAGIRQADLDYFMPASGLPALRLPARPTSGKAASGKAECGNKHCQRHPAQRLTGKKGSTANKGKHRDQGKHRKHSSRPKKRSHRKSRPGHSLPSRTEFPGVT
jgi:GH25 family lysozyme M1 (1,4-beta-N-acetylmuramidase)